MDARGALWPWRGVAPTLRAADIAFGNLECAISNRGFPVPKQFNFRGRPDRLRQVVRFAGLDVLNLANNHAGDYGTHALLDTVRAVRSQRRAAGRRGRDARAPRAPAGRQPPRPARRLRRLLGHRAGVVLRRPAAARHVVRLAARRSPRACAPRGARSDVVIATFHWGVERSTSENARQRSFARAALAAGASAVIGAHPHVLQPIRRAGRAASSSPTASATSSGRPARR